MSGPDYATAQLLITEEENEELVMYRDIFGYWTVGVGHLIDPRKGGRISKAVSQAMLREDMDAKIAALIQNPTFCGLGRYQQAALMSMAFQMGDQGLLKFKDMWAHLAAKEYLLAAQSALNSEWGHQTPERAQREAYMLWKNEWVEHPAPGVVLVPARATP